MSSIPSNVSMIVLSSNLIEFGEVVALLVIAGGVEIMLSSYSDGGEDSSGSAISLDDP